MAEPGRPSDLAEHVSQSVEAIGEFHREHYRRASVLQRGIDRVTNQLGRPLVVMTLVFALLVWTGLTAVISGGRIDEPSFAWLELSATLVALLTTLLILVTQRREDELAERRAQLTLELALIADRKTAKLIALFEELRKDQPDVANRPDAESEAMAQPADPETVLAAIDAEAGRGAAKKP